MKSRTCHSREPLGIIELTKAKIINTASFDRWDHLSILIYLIVSVLIYFDPKGIIGKKEVLFYSYTTPAFLYLFNYKSLRKTYIWGIWILISIAHIWLYTKISEIPKYQYYRGHASEFLKYTWIFLILFQILRILFIQIKKLELVAPNVSGIDIWDKRKLTNLDYIFASVFFGFYIILGILITK